MTNSDRPLRFAGTARAAIQSLDFIPGRETDPEGVRRLIKVFEREGCNRLIPDHFIPVFITSTDLKRALRASKLTPKDLKRPSADGSWCFLKVAMNQKLAGADGRRRCKAAVEHLEPYDHWWTVNLLIGSPEGSDLTYFVNQLLTL